MLFISIIFLFGFAVGTLVEERMQEKLRKEKPHYFKCYCKRDE